MEEIFDIVDSFGRPTGKTIERSKAHAVGARHRTAHIWIIRPKKTDSDGIGYDVLLQKRAQGKDSFPGKYDTSSAGHIQAGDEPLNSALRELEEELGIKARAEDLTFASTFKIQYETQFYGKPFKDNEIAFVFVYQKPVDIAALKLQPEEVESVAWFDLEETLAACENKTSRFETPFCVPVDGLRTLRQYLISQKPRCKWCNLKNPLYVKYHDEEWGQLRTDDPYLFEMLILESFQAGLSWECILNKREAFRKAYDHFDLEKVCAYDAAKLEALRNDPGIVRNLLKIKASVENARIFRSLTLEYGSFWNYLNRFVKDRTLYEEHQVTNALSDAISADLKIRGMKFVGSTIIYAYLQAIGVIHSHEEGCFQWTPPSDR